MSSYPISLAAVCGALLLALLPPDAGAIEFSGSYANLLFSTKDSLGREQVSDLNRLRLTAQGGDGGWSWEVSYDNELLAGGVVRDPLYQFDSRQPEKTWLDGAAYIYRGRSADWSHSLYRGWIQYEQDELQLIVGRQRIAWGSGRIWNPSDRFNPVEPTALEPEQKLGVDAVNAAWRYDDSGSLRLIAAPGNSSRGVSRKVAGRWQDTFGEFDIALMGGRFGSENLAAADLTGNLGDGGLRFEAVRSTAAPGGPYTQLSTGYDYTLTNGLFPQGLYMDIEYFYNSAAPEPVTLHPDRLQSLNRSLWGFQLGYDLATLWRGDLLLLADASHRSLFWTPRLVWSARENLDLTAMAQLVRKGRAGGEFAAYSNLYALRLDLYY